MGACRPPNQVDLTPVVLHAPSDSLLPEKLREGDEIARERRDILKITKTY